MFVRVSEEPVPEGFVRAARVNCPEGLMPNLDHKESNKWELSFVNKEGEKVITRNYYWDDEQSENQNKNRILLIFHRMNDSLKN